MGGRIEFREKLSGILKMAEENGCQITIDEVECYFEEEHLSKEQIELVFDYLLAQKIVVKGYEKTGGSVTSSEENKAAFTEEEQRYLKEYMKDIGGIREADEEEREALFEKVLEGDALAKSRLWRYICRKLWKLQNSCITQKYFWEISFRREMSD